MPMAVAEKSVGNKSAFDKNTRLNVLEVPSLPIMIKTGIQLVREWNSKIVAPPSRVNTKQERKAILTPNLSNSTALNTVPTLSAIEETIMLVYTLPRMYFSWKFTSQ